MKILVDDLRCLDLQYLPVPEMPTTVSFSYRVAIELIRGNYDLVHSHGFTSGICTALPAKISLTSHLMTSHDVVNENQFSGYSGKIKKKSIGRVLSLVNIIQSVSYDAQNNLIENFPELSCPGYRCVVIPNGIEVERFLNDEPRDLRSELNLSTNVFLIGFFGRFMSQKGFRFLIDAIELLIKEQISKKPLVLAFGDGGFIREDRLEVERRGLNDYFYFMPFVSNIASTIQGLDVVVMPSLWEACGLLGMEVMCSGVPFIGFNCIGLREVMRDTPAISVPIKSSSCLASELRHEIFSSRKNEFLLFRSIAADRYNVSKTKEQLEKLYNSIIESKKT